MRSVTTVRPFILLQLSALTVLSGLLTACPGGGSLDVGSGGGTGSGGGGNSFCDAAPIFVAKCDGIFCHGSNDGSMPSGGVELVTPPTGMTLGQSLLNHAATYPGNPEPPACPPATAELIINETAPAESLLLKKINGTYTCGDAMPPSPVTLTPDEMTCITEWVNGTAQTGGI